MTNCLIAFVIALFHRKRPKLNYSQSTLCSMIPPPPSHLSELVTVLLHTRSRFPQTNAKPFGVRWKYHWYWISIKIAPWHENRSGVGYWRVCKNEYEGPKLLISELIHRGRGRKSAHMDKTDSLQLLSPSSRPSSANSSQAISPNCAITAAWRTPTVILLQDGCTLPALRRTVPSASC